MSTPPTSNYISVASLLISVLVALGSWEQIVKGVTTFVETPLAKWTLALLVTGSLAFASAWVARAAGRKLKEIIDTWQHTQQDLQAAVILHQEVIRTLASSHKEEGELHDAVERAKQGVRDRGIILDGDTSVNFMFEILDPQRTSDEAARYLENVDEMIALLEEIKRKGGG